jgi:nitronate monooxygenase
MWADRRLVELFQIEHPLVLAPMAGSGTVELAVLRRCHSGLRK